MLQHFVQRVDVRDFQIAEQFGWKIRRCVWLVVRGKENFLHACALCAQYFFLDAPYRKDHAREGHFARHGEAIANRPAGEQADQRRDHGCAGRWTVFRNRSRRHVNVNVVFAEEVRVDCVFFRVRANPRERRGHGFLHHFA